MGGGGLTVRPAKKPWGSWPLFVPLVPAFSHKKGRVPIPIILFFWSFPKPYKPYMIRLKHKSIHEHTRMRARTHTRPFVRFRSCGRRWRATSSTGSATCPSTWARAPTRAPPWSASCASGRWTPTAAPPRQAREGGGGGGGSTDGRTDGRAEGVEW